MLEDKQDIQISLRLSWEELKSIMAKKKKHFRRRKKKNISEEEKQKCKAHILKAKKVFLLLENFHVM